MPAAVGGCDLSRWHRLALACVAEEQYFFDMYSLRPLKSITGVPRSVLIPAGRYVAWARSPRRGKARVREKCSGKPSTQPLTVFVVQSGDTWERPQYRHLHQRRDGFPHARYVHYWRLPRSELIPSPDHVL